MANSVDPDQPAPEESDLGLHCLPRSVCLKIFCTMYIQHKCCPDYRLCLKTCVSTNEPLCDKTNKMSVQPAKTDQSGHPPSLIRVFAVRSMGN